MPVLFGPPLQIVVTPEPLRVGFELGRPSGSRAGRASRARGRTAARNRATACSSCRGARRAAARARRTRRSPRPRRTPALCCSCARRASASPRRSAVQPRVLGKMMEPVQLRPPDARVDRLAARAPTARAAAQRDGVAGSSTSGIARPRTGRLRAARSRVRPRWCSPATPAATRRRRGTRAASAVRARARRPRSRASSARTPAPRRSETPGCRRARDTPARRGPTRTGPSRRFRSTTALSRRQSRFTRATRSWKDARP